MRIAPYLLPLLLAATPIYAATLNTSPSANEAPASETQFTGAIDDLPLMPGLTPVGDEDTLFVVPRSGRIAQSSAEGSVDIDDVYKFYRKTLPHLGWKPVDARTYTRENEKLRIDAHANGKITTVRFSVNPK